MSFPTTMSGHDRTYMPPRSLRGELGGPFTAWELLRIRGTGEEWAHSTVDGLLAAASADAADALGCVECGDFGFYGLADPADEDLLTGLVRSVGGDMYESLAASGVWGPWTGFGALEVLSQDLAVDVAEAITAGAAGLLRRYCNPLAWIDPCTVVAAAPLAELLGLLVRPGPQETTDGKWVNFAVVDEVDQGAVLDLVRIAASGEAAERRVGSAWIPDNDVLVKADLPMVRLDGVQLAEIQAQVDSSIVAAGLVADAPLTVSPDPRAEKLRRYWSSGKGALKIRWGMPGDWRRCYRHLRKYMGLRARGYCQNLHKRNNSFWTGDRRNRGLLSSIAVDSPVRLASGVVLRLGDSFQMQGLKAEAYTAEVIDCPTLRNRADPQLMSDAMDVLLATGGVPQNSVAVVLRGARVQPVSTKLTSPVVTDLAEIQKPLLDAPAVDSKDPALQVRTILAPTVSQVLEAKAGLPDVIVAAVHAALRNHSGWPHGSTTQGVAVLLPPAVVSLAQTATDDWPSGALIDHTVHRSHNTPVSPEESLMASVQARRWVRETGRITDMPEPVAIADGIYTEADPANGGIMNTLLAGGFPVKPPKKWFDKPELTGPTPLDVTDEGRVYGHIAPWGVSHIGMAGSVVTPKNPDGKYAYFRTGALRTEEGEDVHVGQLTLVGGHAPISATAAQAVKHYDDTNSAVADVVVGEDQYGVWAAGALRPNVTPEQVRAMRACPPSGDWRPVNGRLELVAACHVNVQGFPIAKALYASGAVMALVAAGAREMYQLRAAKVGEPVLAAKVEELQAMVAALQSSAATATLETTGEPVAEGEPLPVVDKVDDAAEEIITAEIVDDSGEVEMTTAELERADKIAAARAIVQDIQRAQLRERVRGSGGVTAALPPKFLANKKSDDGEKKPKGEQSLPDGSFPVSDVASLKDAISAFGRSKNPDAAKAHIKRMARRLKRPDLIPSNWK
jgi:hypothetical protein